MDTIFSTLFDTNLPKMKILRYTDHMDMTIHTCNPLMTSQELYRRVKVRKNILDMHTYIFSKNLLNKDLNAKLRVLKGT